MGKLGKETDELSVVSDPFSWLEWCGEEERRLILASLNHAATVHAARHHYDTGKHFNK